MRDDWILDVLADLGEFARVNQLEALARELLRARQVAMIELSAERVLISGGGDQRAGSHGAHTGNHSERQGT
jgi:hypothetical protein